MKEGIALSAPPRSHDGRLWLPVGREVIGVSPGGENQAVARMPSTPFSLDALPDGRVVVVSARGGQLIRRETNLSSLPGKPWNDIAVDGRGSACIGNLGFEFPGGQSAPATIAHVTPDGMARQVADGMAFPSRNLRDLG